MTIIYITSSRNNENKYAAVHFFVGFESKMFVLPKKLLSCTNVRIPKSAPQKEQW